MATALEGVRGAPTGHIGKLRPWLSAFGVMIRTVIDHGYVLLREPRER